MSGRATTTSQAAIWHDVECGSYAADLPLWRELAEAARGPVLDIGAGTGRVAADLGSAGHSVIALERDRELLTALERRCAALPVTPLLADARDFALARPTDLCIVPMQTVQLLGHSAGRRAFLACARRALTEGGVLAIAITDPIEPYAPTDPSQLPVPDVLELAGTVYSSQPVAIRRAQCATVIERSRETVGPGGEHARVTDLVSIEDLDPAGLAAEGVTAGFEPLAPRAIPATADHVGSTVVMLRA
jgi:SAM-dependent methyltransferase